MYITKIEHASLLCYDALMIFLSDTGILTMIIVRTLRRDIARYNKDDELVSDLVSTACGLALCFFSFPFVSFALI